MWESRVPNSPEHKVPSTVWHWGPCSMLCGSLDWRVAWGKLDTYICVAKSLCCPPETITTLLIGYQFSSVELLCHAYLWPHRLQHTRLPCPSPTPRACSNSRPSGQWCHPTTSSSVIPFSSCLQSFPTNQFFASGGQRIGASVSVLPMNIQDWFPLGLTGLISL